MKDRNHKKTVHELEKNYRIKAISEHCSWDLADIRAFYIRETCIKTGSQLSRKMSEYKEFFNEYFKKNKENSRIDKLRKMMRGE